MVEVSSPRVGGEEQWSTHTHTHTHISCTFYVIILLIACQVEDRATTSPPSKRVVCVFGYHVREGERFAIRRQVGICDVKTLQCDTTDLGDIRFDITMFFLDVMDMKKDLNVSYVFSLHCTTADTDHVRIRLLFLLTYPMSCHEFCRRVRM